METTLTLAAPRRLDRWARNLAFSLLPGLKNAGLTVLDGDDHFFFGDAHSALQAEIQVVEPRFYRRLLSGGSISAAESWVEGDWFSPDLTSLIRLFARNTHVMDRLERRLGWLTWPWLRLSHWRNRNSKAGSRANIAAHYDLGNDMYELFLDPQMQYSSAVFPRNGSSLDLAQEYKLRLICSRLELKPGDHLLEIGTGWGGLACYAARHYGCRVTTTTLSEAQFEYARVRIKREGLEDRVTLLLKDYRELTGQYDKLVSVEMIEAVGHEYLPEYFRMLDRLLKPDGRLLIQAITIADQRYRQYRKSVDFIQRYIFPGGCLPSVGEMSRHLREQTDMSLVRLHDYGWHYAETLRIWAARFQQAAPRLSRLGYSNDFQRLWAFYFAYCEGGFLEGTIGLAHFEAAKPGARTCRHGNGPSL
ncbi:cyclopropane-fatty-acyl-phospholipid synthase family protein [Oceanimonas baumannii]|uniref:SAM-dependent methyltransferase n=1 Tax=Oceanimonas baumannii TaxID=129578 RepID=UPI001D1951C7|nr:cyclopropane-fatty-acyl-phospholipid synthase family protein [Oceanimonas baumannii]MCC4265599.1 cyclopropane-fatty-acyl-phospholipid synthase family protein [Oceanimonas baumannii]